MQINRDYLASSIDTNIRLAGSLKKKASVFAKEKQFASSVNYFGQCWEACGSAVMAGFFHDIILPGARLPPYAGMMFDAYYRKLTTSHEAKIWAAAYLTSRLQSATGSDLVPNITWFVANALDILRDPSRYPYQVGAHCRNPEDFLAESQDLVLMFDAVTKYVLQATKHSSLFFHKAMQSTENRATQSVIETLISQLQTSTLARRRLSDRCEFSNKQVTFKSMCLNLVEENKKRCISYLRVPPSNARSTHPYVVAVEELQQQCTSSLTLNFFGIEGA